MYFRPNFTTAKDPTIDFWAEAGEGNMTEFSLGKKFLPKPNYKYPPPPLKSQMVGPAPNISATFLEVN